MGNSCAVARTLDATAPTPGVQDYSSVLVAWKYSADKHGIISAEFVDFEALKNVSSRACFGVMVVAAKSRKGSNKGLSGSSESIPKVIKMKPLIIPGATPTISSSPNGSLSKLLSSAIDNLTPRGLNAEWKTLGGNSTGSFQHFSYIWVGRRSTPECRAFCMHQMAEKFVSFQNVESLSHIYSCASNLLSQVFRDDADFSEFQQSIHLIRRRFEKRGQRGLSSSAVFGIDAKYKLFGRSELAAPQRVSRSARKKSLASETESETYSDDGEDYSSTEDSSGESDSEGSGDGVARVDEALRERIVEPPTEGDEYSGGIISEFNMADDGGPEPDENEPIPADDAGHGIRVRFFDVRISEITPQLYLGSATGARKRKWLQKRGITHILNCATMILKNWWPDDFDYLSLYLLDGKREDVLCLVYDVLQWIDDALERGEKVFVHCQQGVSRSTTMVVLYLMWKWKKGFREVSSYVKERRNVASPNPGFLVQLLMWEKRLFTPIVKPRLLLMASQSTYVPDLIVPKLTTVKNPMTLMSNEVYILHGVERLWIWTGGESLQSHQDAAHRVAPRMIKFENAPSNLKTIGEGGETEQFWLDLYGGEKPSPRPAPSSVIQSAHGSPKSPAGFKKMPGLRLSDATALSAELDNKRPASPVKLKLNLGNITAQKTELKLNLGLVSKSAPSKIAESPSSSESQSDSETSSETTDESSSSEDECVPEERMKLSPRKPILSTKLRLSDLQPQRVETGPLSPLSNPSVRQSLGLIPSPKRAPVLTLENAKKSLELSSSPSPAPVKKVSPEKDTLRLSPVLSNKKHSSNESSSSSRATSPHSPSNLSVHFAPRQLQAKPVPEWSQSVPSSHLDAILEDLYIGDEEATEDSELIISLGISDVIVVCGGSLARKVAGTKTKTFHCDGDVLCLMFLVISRIREGKRVLIQGSSKFSDYAASFITGYLMLEYQQSLAGATKALCERSPLFKVFSEPIRRQLEIWEERLAGVFLSNVLRVYQVTKQSAKAPTLLVAKMIENPNKSILKPTEVLIIHGEGTFHLWSGKQHKYNTLVAAKKIVAQMIELEDIQTELEMLQQGKESNFFWKVMDSANLASM